MRKTYEETSDASMRNRERQAYPNAYENAIATRNEEKKRHTQFDGATTANSIFRDEIIVSRFAPICSTACNLESRIVRARNDMARDKLNRIPSYITLSLITGRNIYINQQYDSVHQRDLWPAGESVRGSGRHTMCFASTRRADVV